MSHETLLSKLFAKRTELRLLQEQSPSEELAKELKEVQWKIEDVIYDWESDNHWL